MSAVPNTHDAMKKNAANNSCATKNMDNVWSEITVIII